jgi:alpha-beta hydrolase superfamily lysophospholipase
MNPSAAGLVTMTAIERVIAADGHVLHHRVWRPAGAARGTIVLLNGIMSHSAWFFPLVDPLVAAGFVVVGADRRGSGLDDEQRGDAPSAQTLVDDAVAIVRARRLSGKPLLLVGWCWGTVLALNMLRPLGDALDGLVMVAPGLFPTQAVTDAAAAHERRAEGAPADAAVIETPIAETMFTRGRHLDEFIRRDARRLRKITPRFRQHMSSLALTASARLRRLDRPTLVLLAEGDEATDNEAARAALARLDAGVVEIRSTPSGHGMQFDAPGFVCDALIAFAARLGAA